MLNADEFIGPTQARDRLRIAGQSNPIIHAVDMAARHNRLSDVDRSIRAAEADGGVNASDVETRKEPGA